MLKVIAATVLLAQAAMPPMGPVSLPAATQNEGITVSGTASASANATSAQITMHVSTTSGSGSLTRAALQPIADALLSAGVQRGDIIMPPYLDTPARVTSAEIGATVHNPTLLEFERGVAAVGTAIGSSSNLRIDNATVVLSYADCAALIQQAQRIALSRSRADAQSIAAQIGSAVGAVLAVDARSAGGYDGQCGTTYNVGPYSGSPMPMTDYLRVKVYSNVTVRYAIKRG